MKASKKHILIVGGIRETHDALIKEDCRISWLIRKNAMMPNDQNRPYHQIIIYNPGCSIEQLVDMTEAIHKHDPIDIICSFHDEMQLIALPIADKLKIHFNYTVDAIDNTRNKYKMRQQLQQHDLSRIKFCVTNSFSETKAFFEKNKPIEKFILKPIDGTGSSNVIALNHKDMENLEANNQKEQLQYPLLIEEFINGQEYSVEAFTHEGQHYVIAVTEKFKTPGTFMESGHLIPARISESKKDDIATYVDRCLTALNVNCGPTHTEVIVNDDGVFLVETHTRVAGDQIPALVKYTTGIDLYSLTAAQVLNKKINKEQIHPAKNDIYACIQFKVQEASTTKISMINGVKELATWPTVKDIHVSYKIGDTLPPVKHSFDRAASVLVVEDSSEKALAVAADALNKIEFIF